MLSVQELKQKIITFSELPRELLLNVPLITLTGSDELVIENYKGLIEYSDDHVRVSTTVGILCMSGKNICLKSLTSDRILVTGRISKLEFLP